MTKCVSKRGDTLIEVMLAVGIFSMVAVAVVAVMSGGTSSAQTALETTLAREEINTQAEALRFIQSAYIAEKDSNVGKFGELWQAITKESINFANPENINETLLKYSPNDCSVLYQDDNSEVRQYGFAINTRKLGIFMTPQDIIIQGSQKNGSEYIMTPASTYPRLVYSDDANLIDSGTNQNLENVEGIYIIAVKDPANTQIIGTDIGTSAYYDFYIRTCWYGTGDKSPSTISTVIRLYDPGIVNN